MTIDIGSFKQAMAGFPSGVVVAATLDAAGQPCGFTASSFASVSLQPPLVLVCLAKSAECHAAFVAAERYSINVLRAADVALARRFATRGAAKFAGNDFVAGEHGLPLLPGAVAALVCRRHAVHDGGDHTVLLGEVQSVTLAATADAMVYYRQQYWHFGASPAEGILPAAPQS